MVMMLPEMSIHRSLSASPTIGNDTGGCFKGSTVKGKDFITQFYHYALTYGASVKDALDLASLYTFQVLYPESPLYEGYETWWPVDFGPGMEPDWYPGYMRAYGDGNLHFVPWDTIGNLELSAWAWTGEYFVLTSVRIWVDGIYLGYTGFTWLDLIAAPGSHTIEVDDWDTIYSNSEFNCFYVNDEFYSYDNPTTVNHPNSTETQIAALYG
jgi:hypothetical protein